MTKKRRPVKGDPDTRVKKTKGSLTAKQRHFIECKMKGMTNREAYDEAYPTTKGRKASTSAREGLRLMQNSKVRDEIIRLQKLQEDSLILELNRTKAKSMEDLQRVITAATLDLEESGPSRVNTDAIINAVREMNQILGYNKDTELRERKLNADLDRGTSEAKVMIVEKTDEMKEWLKENESN